MINKIIVSLYEKKIKYYASYIGDPNCFKSKPIFPHDVKGVFISREAKIGERCTIFQQVTIGSNQLKDSPKYGAPIIGDDCYIGAGAKIIGSVKIGNNVRIGANAVVVDDIPDNATVVCEKPRVIIKDRE